MVVSIVCDRVYSSMLRVLEAILAETVCSDGHATTSCRDLARVVGTHWEVVFAHVVFWA